jgi:predicted HicB family RNase H-like nuclease
MKSKIVRISEKPERTAILLRLPENLKDWLTNYASSTNHSVNELVVEILTQVMNDED